MPDANYATVLGGGDYSGSNRWDYGANAYEIAETYASVRGVSPGGNLADPSHYSVAVFR